MFLNNKEKFTQILDEVKTSYEKLKKKLETKKKSEKQQTCLAKQSKLNEVQQKAKSTEKTQEAQLTQMEKVEEMFKPSETNSSKPMQAQRSSKLKKTENEHKSMLKKDCFKEEVTKHDFETQNQKGQDDVKTEAFHKVVKTNRISPGCLKYIVDQVKKSLD